MRIRIRDPGISLTLDPGSGMKKFGSWIEKIGIWDPKWKKYAFITIVVRGQGNEHIFENVGTTARKQFCFAGI